MTSMDVGRVRRLAIGLVFAVLVLLSADVASAAKAPALKVSKPAGAPASVAAGGAFTVSVTVKNPGRRKAKAQTVALVLSKDGRADAKDIKLAGALKVKALAARKSAAAKGKLTVPKTVAVGSYKLIACVGKTCAAGNAIAVKAAAPAPPASKPLPSRPSGDTVNLPPGPAPVPNPGDPVPSPGPGPSPTPDPIPQDPKDAAPTLDPGAATSVYDSTKFIYSGANPIQRDVEAGRDRRQAGRRPQGARQRP